MSANNEAYSAPMPPVEVSHEEQFKESAFGLDGLKPSEDPQEGMIPFLPSDGGQGFSPCKNGAA